MEPAKKCMIIAAAPIDGQAVFAQYPPQNFFVICADGGYDTAQRYGVVPNLVVGDFDSARQQPDAQLRSIRLPVEKDLTDTMFAAMEALRRGYRDILILGGLGGERFDHSIANLTVLLEILNHGGRGVLADGKNQVLLLRDARMRLTDMQGTIVSVFPYKDAMCTLTYKGLKYPLNNYELSLFDDVMGVSNEVVASTAEIRVSAGTALVTLYQPQEKDR